MAGDTPLDQAMQDDTIIDPARFKRLRAATAPQSDQLATVVAATSNQQKTILEAAGRARVRALDSETAALKRRNRELEKRQKAIEAISKIERGARKSKALKKPVEQAFENQEAYGPPAPLLLTDVVSQPRLKMVGRAIARDQDGIMRYGLERWSKLKRLTQTSSVTTPTIASQRAFNKRSSVDGSVRQSLFGNIFGRRDNSQTLGRADVAMVTAEVAAETLQTIAQQISESIGNYFRDSQHRRRVDKRIDRLMGDTLDGFTKQRRGRQPLLGRSGQGLAGGLGRGLGSVAGLAGGAAGGLLRLIPLLLNPVTLGVGATAGLGYLGYRNRDWIAKSLSGLISGGESGRGGYDALNGYLGRATTGNRAYGRPLTQMTVGEVIATTKRTALSDGRSRTGIGNSSGASGKYQFIPDTLAETARKAGIPLTAQYNEQTQDALYAYKVQEVMNRARTPQEGVFQLSKIWASIPVPRGMYTRSGELSDGTKSYYGQRTKFSADEFIAAYQRGQTQNLEGKPLPSSVVQSSTVKRSSSSLPTSVAATSPVMREQYAQVFKKPEQPFIDSAKIKRDARRVQQTIANIPGTAKKLARDAQTPFSLADIASGVGGYFYNNNVQAGRGIYNYFTKPEGFQSTVRTLNRYSSLAAERRMVKDTLKPYFSKGPAINPQTGKQVTANDVKRALTRPLEKRKPPETPFYRRNINPVGPAIRGIGNVASWTWNKLTSPKTWLDVATGRLPSVTAASPVLSTLTSLAGVARNRYATRQAAPRSQAKLTPQQQLQQQLSELADKPIGTRQVINGTTYVVTGKGVVSKLVRTVRTVPRPTVTAKPAATATAATAATATAAATATPTLKSAEMTTEAASELSPYQAALKTMRATMLEAIHASSAHHDDKGHKPASVKEHAPATSRHAPVTTIASNSYPNTQTMFLAIEEAGLSALLREGLGGEIHG